MDGVKLLKLNEVAETCRVSERTIRRRLDARDFPLPIRAFPGRLLWDAATLEKWLHGRAGDPAAAIRAGE